MPDNVLLEAPVKSGFKIRVVKPWKRWWRRKLSNSSLQELDGGFFEKFGTLLKDQVAKDENEEKKQAEEEPPVEVEEEPEKEPETEEVISDVIGLNIDELYSEVLYEILHMVGADADTTMKDELFLYLQEAFKLDDEKHSTLLEAAQEKEAPNIILNVEVVQAKELAPKDANGLSDPFCTLYLLSTPTHRYNTSVKSETLSPTWEEHFSLPAENTVDDVLCIEVWDFDPAETVREKMTKITGVKGVRGLRKLMKEIAVTASTGKHDNEIIGCTTIPLKTISSAGQVKWYNIEKKSKSKPQGSIKLKMAFSSEKNNQVAAQEYRHLLRLLILHELENQKTEPAEWDGTFTGPAECILRQHAAQSGLSAADEAMSQWVEFIRLHINHPLNFKLFASIISKVKYPLDQGLFGEDEQKLFWDATKKLLPNIFSNVKKLRKFTTGEKNNIDQLAAILSVVADLDSLEKPESFDLFSNNLYGWLYELNSTNLNILPVLEEAIKQSAREWFQQILENNKPQEVTSEPMLQQAIKVTQHVRGDMQRALELYDKLFYTTVKIPYAKEIYKVYDELISEIVKPVVTELCEGLKPIIMRDTIQSEEPTNSLSVGTSLFELYLMLQRFAVLGQTLFPSQNEELKVSQFHVWFHKGVAHWLDIAVFKALQRIDKAVELDSLIPVDSSVKYSSSAVDTLSIYYQIKTFWKQLAWPDIEGSYTFVAKIIDDICRCSVYYADAMGKKVNTFGDGEVYGKKFQVTNDWCLAINNIDYVRQSINPFVVDLGMEEIVKNLSEFRSSAAADHCRDTLNLVMDNAVETVRNKILELMEMVAFKMTPSVKRFLLEGAELLHQENHHVDRLMQYLDENLLTLHCQLNDDNFERILGIIWENVYTVLFDVIQDNLEKRRPPVFFAGLNETFDILIGFFKKSDSVESSEYYHKIKRMLNIHGKETEALVHSYFLERLDEQLSMREPIHGMLTVKMQFVNDTLRIEVMNARSICSQDTNGSCDPYVKIHLIPEEKFANIVKPRTKIQKRTLFPLFDEVFTLHLTKEQREYPNALVQFVLKDQDFLGMSSQFVSEAFVLFSDIPRTTVETSIHEMSQVHLKLSKPSKQDTAIFKALDHRQGEKLAKDFVKRQRNKMHIQVPNGN